jgi:hypothetical protein
LEEYKEEAPASQLISGFKGFMKGLISDDGILSFARCEIIPSP